MRFIGNHYDERPVDPERCFAEIRDQWRVSQCSRKPLKGKLLCKQHDAKGARIPDDDPVIATVDLGAVKCRKLQKRGWLKGRDPLSETLKLALDRIAELESPVISSTQEQP